ncbi:hypothetical protein G6F63_016048 [Rhizopus arrhizus]|nr:hypothetical protein G6F63_016048 [Rhizopus arrhizus]
MVEFPNNVFGLALNLERDSVGAVILGDYTGISEGDQVKTTGRILEVPVGPELKGRWRPALSPAARCRSRCKPASRLSTRWCRSAAVNAN